MTTLSFLYINGLWISMPLFGLGAVLLWFFILKLVRLGREKRLCSVSLLEQQEIEFAEAGRVVLCVEGPRFTSRFLGLVFDLSNAGDTHIEGRRCWSRARSSSLSRVRIQWQSYEIPSPGTYILRIQGLGTGQAVDAEHRIVFMRPHLPQMVGYIICLVLTGWLLVGSLVLFLFRLMSQGDGA